MACGIKTWFAHAVCRFGDCTEMGSRIDALETRIRAIDEELGDGRARQAVFDAVRSCPSMEPSFEDLLARAEAAIAGVETALEQLSLSDVIRLSGRGKSYIYARIKEGTFPAPVKVPCKKRVYWKAAEVREWLAAH